MKIMKSNTKNENCAHIALNKSRQKEYSTKKWESPKENSWKQNEYRTVYLENGDEFQIELFNPYHHNIGISITFDGEKEGNQLLILKPGERFWLDRYLNNPKRFMFSIYNVEKTEEAKEAISENGKVTIKFYREKKQENPKITWRSNINCIDWEDYPCDWWDDNKITYYNSSIKTSTDNKSFNPTLRCSFNCSDYSNISSFSSSVPTANYSASSTDLDNTIETVRIEEGSQSNQHFHETNQEFESWPFKTEIIKLLPKSQKPVTTAELTKKYCYNCGRKIKDKFRFCPFCGADQNENGEV